MRDLDQWNRKFSCCPTCRVLSCPECGNTDLVEVSITTDQGREYALECDNCGEAFPHED